MQEYKPRTYEEQLQPYLQKYTLERLKPKPIEPIGEPWKDTVEGEDILLAVVTCLYVSLRYITCHIVTLS